MHPPSLDINPITCPIGPLVGCEVIGKCDGKAATEDEVGGEAPMRVGAVVRVAVWKEVSLAERFIEGRWRTETSKERVEDEVDSERRRGQKGEEGGPLPAIGPGEDVVEAPGADEGFGFGAGWHFVAVGFVGFREGVCGRLGFGEFEDLEGGGGFVGEAGFFCLWGAFDGRGGI